MAIEPEEAKALDVCVCVCVCERDKHLPQNA